MKGILNVSKLDVRALVERAKGLERAKPNTDLSLARKCARQDMAAKVQQTATTAMAHTQDNYR